MKDYNEDYFFLEIDNSPSNPILALDDDFKEYVMDFLRNEPIVYDKIIQLKFRNPVPKKPRMADFHSFSSPSPVFSVKLKKVVEDMQIKNIQFVPVLIRGKSDELIEGYHAIKVCNTINCTDLEKSVYDTFDDGRVCSFDKLVLNNKKLEPIPLKDRLIFAIGEKRTYVVYHISVVEKMLETAPEGMTVYRLAKWDSSAPFYDAYYDYISEFDDDDE